MLNRGVGIAGRCRAVDQHGIAVDVVPGYPDVIRRSVPGQVHLIRPCRGCDHVGRHSRRIDISLGGDLDGLAQNISEPRYVLPYHLPVRNVSPFRARSGKGKCECILAAGIHFSVDVVAGLVRERV